MLDREFWKLKSTHQKVAEIEEHGCKSNGKKKPAGNSNAGQPSGERKESGFPVAVFPSLPLRCTHTDSQTLQYYDFLKIKVD